MKKLIFKLMLRLDINEIGILLKAINLYIFTSTTFDYADDLEICHDLLNRIKRNLSTEYLSENMLN